MDHSTHEGTIVPECPECQKVAYEAGWYVELRRRAALLADDILEVADVQPADEDETPAGTTAPGPAAP